MAPDHRVAGRAMGWMAVGEWRAHPGRAVTAALAIAIGVALGFAVHLVNLSALDEFARAVQAVNGEADLQVRSVSAAGFDEALYPVLSRVPGVASVSPGVELAARTGSSPVGGVTLLGLDVLRAAVTTPSLVVRAGGVTDQPEAVFDPEALHMSPAALASSGRKAGEWILVTAAGRSVPFRIAGVLASAGDDQKLAVADIAAVQMQFGQLGRLQRLDLRLAEGANRAEVEARIRQLLPPDAQLSSRESDARRSDSLSRAYRVNLEMLAMVALLTGGFLVYSAQSLSVARRRPQFALLRVLGLKRRDLLLQVLGEGLVVGGVGALAGIGLGLGLADLALRLLGGDLGGGYFAGGRPKLAFAPGAAAVFLGLGLAAALTGSLLPALEAGRAKPAVALKSLGDLVDPNRLPSPWPGFGLMAAGGLAALAPPIGGLPLLGYGAIALILAGGVAAMPWLARMLLSPLRRLGGVSPALNLALSRLWGAPSQAAVALCGIVASTSLMIAMAVMVASFRGSVDDWLLQVLPADLYVRLESNETGGFDPDLQARLAATPGVKSIRFRKSLQLRLSPDRPPVTLSVLRIDPARPQAAIPILGAVRSAPPGRLGVFISEPMARLYGLKVGQDLSLPLAGQRRSLFVAGVWRDYARQFGAVAMNEADYVALTGDQLKSEAAIDLAPGALGPAVIDRLRARLPAALAASTLIAEPRQIRATALRIFDRSFAVTYALEAIAIVVGLAGVAATFSAQTIARTREFGMLRHIGVQRSQIMLMLAAEGAILGAVGGVAGLGLGAAMGQILIQVVNPQSFHWTMDTTWPLGLFAGLMTALVAASAGTALLAGRSALSQDAVRAVREDW